MIYLKNNPTGIDSKIQGIQEYLYKNLKWDIESFGRSENNGKKVTVFKKGKDYQTALTIANKTSGRFFFVDDNETEYKNGSFHTEIDIIFLLDVKKIKPNIEHRADEEVRLEVLDVLKRKVHLEEIKITKGIEAVKEFNHKLVDMQPYHFFKFSFTLKYSNNNC